jgi:hypothetical protein
MEHDKKLSANPEADQLWKEFDRSLDEVSVTEEQISKASDDKNIQCLSFKALSVIIGKIQVALGAIEMSHPADSGAGKLRILHAKLQVLNGTMFPYLAVRLKQSPRTVLESAIDACRTPSSDLPPPPAVDTVQEGSTRSTDETDQSEDTASDTSPAKTSASDADSSAGSLATARGGGIRRRK